MRDAKGLEWVDGLNYLASVPKGEIITGMTVFNDCLYVTSDCHLYKLTDDKRLELADQPKGE